MRRKRKVKPSVRRFIVAFKADGGGEGSLASTTRDGGYVNRALLESSLRGAGYDKVVFTSIIEISNNDYKDYKDYNR